METAGFPGDGCLQELQAVKKRIGQEEVTQFLDRPQWSMVKRPSESCRPSALNPVRKSSRLSSFWLTGPFCSRIRARHLRPGLTSAQKNSMCIMRLHLAMFLVWALCCGGCTSMDPRQAAEPVHLYLLDPASGAQRWKVALPPARPYYSSFVAAGSDAVVVGQDESVIGTTARPLGFLAKKRRQAALGESSRPLCGTKVSSGQSTGPAGARA